MTQTDDILLALQDKTAHLILNRPSKKNALTVAMWRAIPPLLERAAQERPNLRLLVICGAGGAFAAGADIAEFADVYASREAAIENHVAIQAAMAAVEAFPSPTLAAIEGACVGGGCGLALACDLRYAAADARFGVTPGRLGLVYGVSDTRRLVDAVGLSHAKDILFSGRLFDAERALAIGLVDRVADAHTPLETHIDTLARDLSAASSHTARTTKHIIRMLKSGLRDDNDESRQMFADAFSGPDLQEGLRAFMEKRPPNFA